MSEAAEEWEIFKCANCEDVHAPDRVCYCGCSKWEKGEKIDLLWWQRLKEL
jgi:hypothetical protein